jgi:hypothetical protein
MPGFIAVVASKVGAVGSILTVSVQSVSGRSIGRGESIPKAL